MQITHWQVQPIEHFSNIVEKWDLLNNKNNNQAVMNSTFVFLLLSHFSNGNEKLILGWQGEELRCAGIFYAISKKRWAIFQPSQAPLGVFIADQGLLTYSLAKQIATHLPGKPLLIDFTQIDEQCYQYGSDEQLEYSSYIETGSLAVPADFDAYFKSLSKNARQNINKAKNRLAKENVTITLNIEKSADALRELVAIYGDIESVSWKNSLGTAIHKDNEQGKFYSDLLETFAQQTGAQAWCYFFDEECVAVDLCIVKDEKITILKTTYKEQFARYSPALLLKIDAYQQLSEQNEIKAIEYFGKVMDWHKRLKCDSRRIFHVTWCKYPWLLKVLQKLKSLIKRNK